jgi:2-aminoadipate transaminase
MELHNDAFWLEQFSLPAQRMGSALTRELWKVAGRPGVISLAGGTPSPDLLPVDLLRQASDKVLREQGQRALQYSLTEGLPELREWIAGKFVGATTDNVQITTGSQQALGLIGQTFINPGDKVIVESPTYLGALQAFNAYMPHYLAAPLDSDGLVVDQLEPLLQQNPKFIYVLPNFQNPSGATLSLERRKKLVELARQYRVPILEDDAYHFLSFEGVTLPSLYEIDHALGGGNVIHTSTFSKTVAPGLRVAWVVGPKIALGKICQMKQGNDSMTPTFSQLLVLEVAPLIESTFVPQIRAKYKQHCEVMLESLRQHLPQAKYTIPKGGMFFWLEMPKGLNTLELLKTAVEHQVVFVPGATFYPDGSGHHALRLSFSNASPENIQLGVERLSKAVESMAVSG